MIQVFSPMDTATATSDLLTTTASNIFEGEGFSRIDVFEADVQEMGIINGWYQVNINLPFTYEEIK